MQNYPKLLRLGADGSAVFEREPGLYAVHYARTAGPSAAGASSPGQRRGEDAAVAVVHEGTSSSFAVYRGEPGGAVSEADVGPVYSAGPGGPLAVPTGRVLVRLAEGMKPEERRQAFAAAGFEIEKTLPYAPSAAWLEPREGGVAHALDKLEVLGKTPGVEHVEPQLLMVRVFKHA